MAAVIETHPVPKPPISLGFLPAEPARRQIEAQPSPKLAHKDFSQTY